MPVVFRACAAVLEKSLVPMHYRELTSRALTLLNIDERRVNMKRQIEDVREKLLEVGQLGAAYIPSPHCMGVMRHWFRTVQQDLWNVDRIVVPGSASIGASAVLEALMRFPHMQPKNPYASLRTRASAAGRGFVTEKHLTSHFKTCWPEFYIEPDNDGVYERWCDHDFKLKLPGRTEPVLVDVWGQAANGTYRAPPGKRPVHFHLQARIEGDTVLWEGVATETMFRDGLIPQMALSPIRMCVYLNCMKHGLDYEAIASFMRCEAA